MNVIYHAMGRSGSFLRRELIMMKDVMMIMIWIKMAILKIIMYGYLENGERCKEW